MPRARTSVLLLASIVIAACGSKSGLEIPEPPRDAAPPIDAFARDVPIFATLPCRWTFGEDIALTGSAGGSYPQLAGTSSLELERVAIRGLHPDNPSDGWLVAPSDPPVLDRAVAVAADPSGAFVDAFGRPGGWVEIVGTRDTCIARWRDRAWNVDAMQVIDAERGCAASALDERTVGLVLAGRGDEPSIVATLDLEIGAIPDERFAMPGATRQRPYVTRDPDGTLYVVYRDRDLETLAAAAQRGRGGPVLSTRDLAGVRVVLEPYTAPDRLRGGAVVLSRELGGTWRLDRIVIEESTIVLLPVMTLDTADQPDEESIAIVTNETEVLFALGDGTMLDIPLDGTARVRRFDPPTGRGVRLVRVVLAPGTSAGGQIWEHAGRAHFRPMVCNR